MSWDWGLCFVFKLDWKKNCSRGNYGAVIENVFVLCTYVFDVGNYFPMSTFTFMLERQDKRFLEKLLLDSHKFLKGHKKILVQLLLVPILSVYPKWQSLKHVRYLQVT